MTPREGAMDAARVLERAREVIVAEQRGLAVAAAGLDGDFVRAVDVLEGTKGRILVSGLGKSGLVGRKLAATMTSTGSPALFIHAVDALHGDLGALAREDAVILCSNSGETDEVVRMIPLLRRMSVPILALTASAASTLARGADAAIAYGVAPEASAVRHVPTTSTTAMLAVGDALAVVLMERKGFREADFAFLHPGGVIGHTLGRRVAELMHEGEDLPVVRSDATLQEALLEILRGRVGATTVIDAGGRLAGLLTDGDLKRVLLKHGPALDRPVRDVMTVNPRTIDENATAVSAVERMENNAAGPITCLVVVDSDGRPAGIVHLHDCLRPG
jgi:arabinose-5-phosphate isomerase